MKLCIAICFFVTTLCYAQNEALIDIINSDSDSELRQQKIDSLIAFNEQNSPPIQLADFYHDLAYKWFFLNWWYNQHKKDFGKAIFYTHKALEIKKSRNSLEEGSLEKTLFNLGYFNFSKGNIYEALNFYLVLVDTGKENRIVQNANLDLGKLYASIGDFYKALDRFNEFILFYSAKDIPDKNERLGLANAYIHMADTYSLMGLQEYNDEIGLNLIKADSILKNLNDLDTEKMNRINQLEGNRLLTMANYNMAIVYHKKILKDSVNLNPHNIAIVYNSLATSRIKLQDFDTALADLNNAISYDIYYTDSYESLGNLYLAQKEFEKALLHYQKAIVYAIDKNKVIRYEDIPTLKDLELVPEKVYLLNHIVTKANGWLKYYYFNNNKTHLVHALETFALADQLVDLIRFESTEYQSKLYWREQGSSLYMKAVEVCHLLNKSEEAFHFMERNKALLLLEDLTNEEAKEIANLPQELAQREFILKREIHLSENSLQETEEVNPEFIVRLKDSIRKNKYRYERFVDSLNKSYPDYVKFKKKAAVLAFKDLKTNYLSGNKALLHYILNEEQGYGLLTLPDTTLLFQMNDIPKLNKDVETLIATLANGVSDMGMFRKVSNSVFGQLLPKNIYCKIKGKQILIIPDYTIQRIPFEALVVTKAGPKYLIEDVEISYAYSMSLLDHIGGKENEPPNNLVAFAPVQFDSMGLPQLYFSENEVTGIAEVYPGKIFLNGRASKSNFIENIGHYKIVHLATHADVGDGENPWIAFSDSKMYLKEIYATRNQADMVVLSGCNTSNGKLKRGEGVMSLARGFFYSGSKSVVSTLWPVADEAGKELLISFYENLNKGDSKSAALHKAKLTYLRNTEEVELKHPYYWAGFIVVGDNAPMVAISYWYWVLLALGLLVLVFLLFKGKSFKGIQ